MLALYGCDETTIVAGLLHDVIEDGVRDGWTREMAVREEKGASAVRSSLLNLPFEPNPDPL